MNDDDELRAFVLARIAEDEQRDHARGLAPFPRQWERDMADHGSITTLRLIASTWSGHEDYRDQWAPGV